MPGTKNVQDLCFSQQPSIYKVSKELKKEAHSLWSCLSSIVDDAAFCSEIRVLYPDLPLLANLRCGLWYAPHPSATCYFKSTDGHQGHHQFSTTRLNWHVADMAARKGGCIIVDATRKGKRFPDAMSKTIPIWATVINRAVARVRQHDSQKEQRRRSYTTQDGEVLTPVADTQTSISVRDDGGNCTAHSSTLVSSEAEHAGTAAAEGHSAGSNSSSSSEEHDLLQQGTLGLAHQQQQQQQQHQQEFPGLRLAVNRWPAPSGTSQCSSTTQIEELLVDCMGDSMELLSGLAVNVPMPGTPDLDAAHQPGALSQQPSAAAAAALAKSLTGPSTTGSPLCRSTLQRSMSVQISPQPSLQEWLDETDLRYRLALLHDCRSPGKRAARISCHSIIAGNMGDSINAGVELHALFASSAPAVCCWLGTSPTDSSPLAMYPDDLPVQPQLPQPAAAATAEAAAATAGTAAVNGVTDHAAVCCSGFTLTGGAAAEPVTPRLGCSSALPATFDSIHEALQEEAAPDQGPAATTAAAAAGHQGLTSQQLRMLEQHHEGEWGKPVAGGPPTVGSAVSVVGCDAAGDTAGDAADFAFPPPHLIAQSAGGSSLAEAAGSAAALDALGSTGSSCGCSGLALPDMPVVVLNGTSHQPGDAASILDIWRSTDLEDVATLPGISDFRPGVYHLPCQVGEEDGEPDGAPASWPTRQEASVRFAAAAAAPEGQVVSDSDGEETSQLFQECCSGWGGTLAGQPDGQQRAAAGAAGSGAAAGAVVGSVSSSFESSCSWIDEEAGLGCDGLCAFAPPPAIITAAAASGDDSASACSASSAACLRPGSPSGCSSCSMGSSSSGKLAAAAAGTAAEWDTALHLPLWVSENERQAIEAKLDGFVERLLEVGADVRGLAAQLHKPLRPLWVSQDSLIWTNQVAHPSTLPFTPLLLVSASQPHQRERQAARAAWLQLAASNSSSSVRPLSHSSIGSPGCSSDLDDWSDDEEPGSQQGLRNSSKAAKLSKAAKHRAASTSPLGADAHVLGSWSYVYVPGAGDDEESWAAGLTPQLFWDNCAQLLSCGPGGIRPAVKQLLQRHKSMMAFGGGASSGWGCGLLGQLQLQPQWGGRSGPAAPLVQTDRHHPAPRGCGGGEAGCGAAGAKVVRAAPGALWLGSTGLALGNLEGATAADVWRTFDAVLCCGTALSPALQQEYQALQLSSAHTPAVPLAAAAPADAYVSVCGSAPASMRSHKAGGADSRAGAGLCFKPTYSWGGGSHSINAVSSSCSDWSKQQQAGGAAGQVAVLNGHVGFECSKMDAAPVLASKRVKKCGMLTELLSQARAAQQPAVPAGAGAARGCDDQSATRRSGHTRTDSVDSIRSTSSCSTAASDGSGSSDSSVSDSNCSSSYYSTCSEEGSPSGGAAAAAARRGAGRSQLQRLKWIPVENSKRDKCSLKQHLQEALEFVSAHLAAGHLVLLHDLEGYDNCVCVAVAALLACFSPPEAAAEVGAGGPAGDGGGGGGDGAAEPHFVAAWQAGSGKAYASDEQDQQLPPALVSKHSVRQRLALVSSCYPAARPTRAALKQVFNFFEERRRASLGCMHGTPA